MSRDIWFTSDTHFFHNNIIRYCNRPFNDVEEMNEKLIENWNRVVKKGDLVYHLGDVWMGGTQSQHGHLMSRLNGGKRLIVGNHDDIEYLALGGWFQKTMMWRVWNDKPLLFTHVPVHESSIQGRIVERGGINVHGHIHDKPSPKGPYKCICVEQTNYTPVHLEEL